MSGASNKAPEGVRRTERVIFRAYVLFRVAGLAQIAITVPWVYPHYGRPFPVLGLLAIIAGASAGLLALGFIRGRVPPPWAGTLDVVVLVGGIFVGSRLANHPYEHTWANYMYPFSILCAVGIGLVFQRLRSVLAASIVLAAASGMCLLTQMGDPPWNVVPDVIPYLLNATVAWTVARTMHRLGSDLDLVAQRMASQAAETARERERAWHSRVLHNRVLQTLESLSAGPWLNDERMRRLVIADTVWLRLLVTRNLECSPLPNLADILGSVASRAAKLGITVDLRISRLRTALSGGMTVPSATSEAVAEAALEALVNVAKHANTDRASVYAELKDGELLVTVLDHGHGFDSSRVRTGVGQGSIREGLAAVGGHVLIESVPGEGTYVELRVPISNHH